MSSDKTAVSKSRVVAIEPSRVNAIVVSLDSCAIVSDQPAANVTLVVQNEASEAPVGCCSPLFSSLSHPDQLFIMLHSYFRNQDVKPVGVREQPVVNTGVSSSWESFKGFAGGSTPIHQLTGLDVPLRGSSACRSAVLLSPRVTLTQCKMTLHLRHPLLVNTRLFLHEVP
jgi:hypothetical protein